MTDAKSLRGEPLSRHHSNPNARVHVAPDVGGPSSRVLESTADSDMNLVAGRLNGVAIIIGSLRQVMVGLQ